MEDLERMTQETADGLIEAFKEFTETAEAFRSVFESRMEVYMTECQHKAAEKFVNYMHKYACGTFLTRWYWLRKARKCNDALKGIIQFNEEHFKHE